MARIIVREEVCKGCEMCVNACPKKIIRLSKDRINAKGYHPAELIDEEMHRLRLLCDDVS